MTRSSTITVRVEEKLKRKIEQRARSEHRSLSAQVEHELTKAMREEPLPAPPRPGVFLGRCSGLVVPEDTDFIEVRQRLWAGLSRG